MEYETNLGAAMKEALEERELLGDVQLVEHLKEKYRPGILILERDEDVGRVYYLDSYGDNWDETTHRKLPKAEVEKARLEELRQVYNHNVYTKVPLQQCIDETGQMPITVRWLDVNKGDEENPEYRSRLVAQEIKRDKREGLIAATPPLEANKMLLSMAVTEGMGHHAGEK